MNGELIDDLQAIIINKIVAIALQVITGRNMAGGGYKTTTFMRYVHLYLLVKLNQLFVELPLILICRRLATHSIVKEPQELDWVQYIASHI